MSLKSYVLCWQDLLCYLIDDGGFLVMSNQRDHWKKVGFLKYFLSVCTHSGFVWLLFGQMLINVLRFWATEIVF